MRRLALGDDAALREWLADESAPALARARRHARENLARMEACGARLVTIADEDYPPGLRDLGDPPPFLIVRGTLDGGAERGVAIVGTRTPADVPRAFAYELAQRLRTPIVAGLAHGIDAAAHEGALAAGMPTIAYTGSGIALTYPRDHQDLADRIVAGGGAIASERLPDDDITRWALVRRDRLQAAHARAVVLIATEAQGGAMHTLAAAKKLGRPRYALEGAPDVVGDGNAIVLAEGARALPFDVECARAIVDGEGEYGW